LASLLAKPTDAPGLKRRDAKRLAISLLYTALNPDRTGQSANFEPPIEILELKGPLQLYRLYDGMHSDACGDWWVEAEVVRQAVTVASRQRGFDAYDRQAFVLKLLRSAVCVHPEWTNYTDIARLDLAHGRKVPAIKGRASPRALRMSPAAMESALGQLFLPGEIQYFIPSDFIKPILVEKIQRNSPDWPFFNLA
jgi:hypothetical protein